MTLVCGNTADMLSKSRSAKHVEVIGEKATHYGLFPCGPSDQTSTRDANAAASCC